MSNNAPHPISIEKLLFVRSIVIAMQGFTPGTEAVEIQPNNHINVETDPEDIGRYVVSMRTLINKEESKSIPYSIDMECLAVLRADNTLSPDEALRGVTITGHSVLFGAIREAVAWTTGRQPFGPLLLGLSVLRPQ